MRGVLSTTVLGQTNSYTLCSHHHKAGYLPVCAYHTLVMLKTKDMCFFFLLPLYYNSDWGRGLRCFLLFPKALPQYAKSNAVRHPKVLKQLLTPWNRNCAEAMEEVFSCVTARLCQIIILINNCNC